MHKVFVLDGLHLTIFHFTCRTNFTVFKDVAQGAFSSLHIVDCRRMHDKARPYHTDEIPKHVHPNSYFMIIVKILGERDEEAYEPSETMIENKRENYNSRAGARRKGNNEGERRMSYHMPRVDTLALNPLVVLIEYSCTDASMPAPGPKPKASKRT